MNYILQGEQRYLVDKKIQQIKKQYIEDENSFNVIAFDMNKNNIQEIVDELNTIPLFGNHKMVIVENALFLSNKHDSKHDIDRLMDYIKQPAEYSVLILICSENLDNRKKIVNEFKKHMELFQYNSFDENQKITFINEQLKKYQIQIEKDAYQELIQRLPMDLQIIHKELLKLSLYPEKLNLNSIQSLIQLPLEEDVFRLVNAVVEKNKKIAFLVWDDIYFIQKDSLAVIYMLASQFRFLYQVRSLLENRYDKTKIAQELHAHPYRVQLAIQTCQKRTLQELNEILNELAKLDQGIKSGSIDKRLGFELFLLNM